MSEDGHRGSTSLKLALGRLLPSRIVRDQIELTVQTIQILALRGSLVANTAVINSLEAGQGCPPVQDVTHIESCPNCRNEAGTGPKILHHDLHGAMNIRKIFLEEVAGRGRPQCFTRGTERLSNLPSTFHP